VRRGLSEILYRHSRWQVAGQAGDGETAIQVIEQLKPDVVTTDFAHPGPDGIEIIRRCSRTCPDTKFLMVTMHASKQLLREILDAGGRGYIMSSDAVQFLIPSIEAILSGKLWFSSTVSEILLDGFLELPRPPGPPVNLTSRELKIVKLPATGKSNKEVASELNVSLRMAETHRANLMNKLQLRSIQDLVRYAVKNQIVEL
jgi:DNA-binding NarL/FixJ family response regulator